MSLAPKHLDFIEAKNAASRDIALGVPPMLLGIAVKHCR
jgi:phage portal protein BeeE